MSNESSSSSSAAASQSRLVNLENKVAGLEGQLTEIAELLKANQGNAGAAAPTSSPAGAAEAPSDPPADNTPSAAEAFQLGSLQISLPAPSADHVAEAFAARRAYSSTGKLNKFGKPATIAPFPAKRFIPEPQGLFDRIKSADQRDGWEAEVLWNIGNNCENALGTAHKVTEALAAKDLQGATEAFAVLNHFLQASFDRVLERVDFLADALESGKQEAILLQKYLREDDYPYSSELYRSTKQKFAEFRSQAYAKEFNKQQAASTGSRQAKFQGNADPKAKPPRK